MKYYLENICCLCLNVRNVPFSDINSKYLNDLSHFEKISTSFQHLATEMDGCMICEKCCAEVNIVYNLNKIWSSNLKTLSSYKAVLKANGETKKCSLNVKLVNIPNVKIGERILVVDRRLQNQALNNKEIKNVLGEDMEVATTIEINDDYNIDVPENSENKMQSEQANFKENCSVINRQQNQKSDAEGVKNNTEDICVPYKKFETFYQAFNMQALTTSTSRTEYVEPTQKPTEKSKIIYSCNLCSKKFSDIHRLQKHKRIHFGMFPYMCPLCKDKLMGKKAYSKHILNHTGNKLYVCDVCQKPFRSKQHLIVHKVKHTAAKTYVCNICDKSYAQSRHFIEHKRTHKKKEKGPFSCNLCKKSFKIQHNLMVHMRIHTGEMPYSCDKCCRAFTVASSFKQHICTKSKTQRSEETSHGIINSDENGIRLEN